MSGQAIVLILGVLGIRAVFGLGWIYTHYVYVMKTFVIPYVVQVQREHLLERTPSRENTL